MQTPADTPVLILCGGQGTRLKEDTEYRPKPMVPIGNHPMLWHIMHLYSRHGFRKFILCLGFKADIIKAYFLHYPSLNSDFTIDLKTNKLTVHSIDHGEDWEVTLADTGAETMTGARLYWAAQKYLRNAEHVAVTYGDGLTNANLAREFDFHKRQNKIGTILGVNPPSRFGEMEIHDGYVTEFHEKPDFKEKWINGGFFFFKKEFFGEYLKGDTECVLESHPLTRLASEGQLAVFQHTGFWACMDTHRDRDHLNKLWNTGAAPWTNPYAVTTTSTNLSRVT